jgi:Flagellar motor switch protein
MPGALAPDTVHLSNTLESDAAISRELVKQDPRRAAQVVKEWCPMASEQAEFSGLDRAAVLLLSLGEDQAAEIMRHLGPREVQRLGVAMSKLSRVSADQAHAVMREFREKIEQQTALGLGPTNFCAAR